MAKITGIDVSEWQKSIDWATVKSQIDFASYEKDTVIRSGGYEENELCGTDH